MKIEEQIQLNRDEQIYLVRKYKSKSSAERCRYFYNILNNNGEKVGSVVYKEEGNHHGIGIKKFTIKRYDSNEKLVFKSEWGDNVNKAFFINEIGCDGLKKLKNVLRTRPMQKN